MRCDTTELWVITIAKRKVCFCVCLRANIIIITVCMCICVCVLASPEQHINFYK
jgi:hypothetical protein